MVSKKLTGLKKKKISALVDFRAVAHDQSNQSAQRREGYANQFKEILNPDLHLLMRMVETDPRQTV